MRRARLGFTQGLALPAAVLAAFFVLPFAGLLVRAGGDGGTWDHVRSSATADALVLSLVTATAATVLAIVLGTPVALLLARRDFRGKGWVDTLVALPIVLPPTVAGVALLTAFGRRGLVGEPLEEVTGITLGFTTAAVILAQLFVAAPFYVRAARAGFDGVDPLYERVAYTLGASELRTFVRVTVPLAWPSLLAGVVLCWARAVGELGATLLFAGNLPGETQTMPLAILQAFESSAGLTGAVALAVVLLAVAVPVLWLLRLALRVEEPPA